MRKDKLGLISIAACVLLSLGSAYGADEATYQATCDAAEQARKAAAEARYEWNTANPLMGKAAEAAEAGDFDKAVSLCTEAKRHSEVALAQAKRESTAWQAAVIK